MWKERHNHGELAGEYVSLREDDILRTKDDDKKWNELKYGQFEMACGKWYVEERP